MSNVKALEGQWYSDRSTSDVFCVIAIDEGEGLIDIRDGYGDIDEFDFDEWESMDLVLCGAPEDWSATDEDLDGEDLERPVNSSLYDAMHDAMQEIPAQRPASAGRR